MILALTFAALAADPAAWPLEAPAVVADSGAVRIDLPGEWLARCPDPSTYLVRDGDGRELPFAVRTSDDAPPSRERLRWSPRPVDAHHWQYRVLPTRSGHPAVALSIWNLPAGTVARVVVRHGDGVAATGVVWNLPRTDAGVGDRIPLPPTAVEGPWQVELWTVRRPRSTRPEVSFGAEVERPGEVAERVWTAPAARPLPAGAGRSATTVDLGRSGLVVRGWTLRAEERAYARPLRVVADGRTVGAGLARRVEVSELTLPEDRIPWRGEAPARVQLELTDDRSPPLHLHGLDVHLRGAALLVPDGPAGTWTVAGCGPPAPPYDVERLGSLLVDRPLPRVRPEPPRASLAWTTATATSGLAGPGRQVDPGAFPLRRVIDGEPGLARLRLPADIAAGSRSDYADLRVLGSGNLVPHLVEPVGPRPLDGVTWDAQSSPGRTDVQIALPGAGLPVDRLVVRTDRDRFERGVELLDDGRPVASTVWRGPGPLILPLAGRTRSAHLTLRIDDGDDGPLPLEELGLTWTTADVVFAMPAGGASLSWGAPERGPPEYDLALLRDELLATPTFDAHLGDLIPPTEAAVPPRAVTRRPLQLTRPPEALVQTAVLLLALVLGVLAFRLAILREEGAD